MNGHLRQRIGQRVPKKRSHCPHEGTETKGDERATVGRGTTPGKSYIEGLRQVPAKESTGETQLEEEPRGDEAGETTLLETSQGDASGDEGIEESGEVDLLPFPDGVTDDTEDGDAPRGEEEPLQPQEAGILWRPHGRRW